MKYSSTAWSNAHTGSNPLGSSNFLVGRPSFCFNENGEKSSKISISSVPSALASVFVHTLGTATTSPVVTPSNQLSKSRTAAVSRSTHASLSGSDAFEPCSIDAVNAT